MKNPLPPGEGEKLVLRTGLQMSLSGMYNVGHDIGGFAGPVPDAEMLIRWTQSGVLHPRFIMNSWKPGGIFNSPFLHPEATPAIFDAIRPRYRLLPYIYSLMVEAAERGAPVIRPTFVAFGSIASRCSPPQRDATVTSDAQGWRIAFGDAVIRLSGAALTFEHVRPGLSRVWFSLVAEPGEHIWGGGEQMSYLDLRGRRYPIWTSEPGVGRDKSTAITQQADAEGKAGGDYWTTNYPQPTFLSSRRFAVHVETTALDFERADRHGIEVWAVPERFGAAADLPDWILGGAIIGLKDGPASFDRLERIMSAGVEVAALWCEDWAGVRETSFGIAPAAPTATFALQETYLYGRDLLVAPVIREGATSWPVYLPSGVDWVHLWSGTHFAGGQTVTVPAPLGGPPVFWREDSVFGPLFEQIRTSFQSAVE